MDVMASGAPAHPHHPDLWVFLGASPWPTAAGTGMQRALGAPEDAPWLLWRPRGRPRALPPPGAPAGSAHAEALREAGPWLSAALDGEGSRVEVRGVPDLDAAPARLRPLFERLRALPPIDADAERLLDAAAEIRGRPGFDALIGAGRVRFEPFAHQLQTAATVLRRMRGRAILADEVGLGKTIEAGLVLHELFLRRLAARAHPDPGGPRGAVGGGVGAQVRPAVPRPG